MTLELSLAPGEIKRLKGAVAAQDQLTFQTPLNHLRPFVQVFLSAIEPIDAGQVTIAQIVFEPIRLQALVEQQLGQTTPLQNGNSLSCSNGVEELLVAALADPIDFFFVPAPRCFALFADHDEYCTVYSVKKSRLGRLARAFSELGIEPVTNYVRRW